MNGVTLGGAPKPATIRMCDMIDGQIAVVDGDEKTVVQCFNSTQYGANKIHFVTIGKRAGASYSQEKGYNGPMQQVRLLTPGETLTIR